MPQRLSSAYTLPLLLAALVATTAAADDAPAANTPTLALVIDDVGYNLERGRRAIALPGPVTVAILPFAPNTTTLAELAASRGADVILHEPMQAADAPPSDPGTLTVAMSEADLRDQFERALADVPQAIGVNNHTGSLLTARRPAMNALMNELRVHGLFFLDSRTTAETVALHVAAENGVPAVPRDVFLDHVVEAREIEAEFERAITIARRRGHVVVIAHPNDISLEFLERALPTLATRGVAQIRIVDLVENVRPAATPVLSADRASPHTGPAL
jgi:polysaccharide deacetylase 2 family uncharacterized protein YibQ